MRMIAVSMLMIVASVPAPLTAGDECSGANVVSNSCTATITTDSLVIADIVTNVGDAPVSVAPGPGSRGPVSARPEAPRLRCGTYTELCRDEFIVNAPAPEQTPAPQAAAPVTISDLASFTPAVGELVVQPDGWGVLGVPTNFHATATDHVQDGTLLGQPIQVRWRPESFTFDHGDGTSVTTTDPGAPWTGTDDDWTETSTSHEYEDRGQFTATLTVTFAADIAAPEGWVTVPGTLDVAAPAEQLRIFEVQTVLTRGNCIDYPDDPGCRP